MGHDSHSNDGLTWLMIARFEGHSLPIADFQPDGEDLPPCVCRGTCLGDCPWCNIVTKGEGNG